MAHYSHASVAKETFVWLAVWIFSVQSSYHAQESKHRWLPKRKFLVVFLFDRSFLQEFLARVVDFHVTNSGKGFQRLFEGVFSLAYERGLPCKLIEDNLFATWRCLIVKLVECWSKVRKKKTVLKQGTSAEKEFLCTKCYSNLRKENGMSLTQEETLQSGALEVRQTRSNVAS